MRVAVIPTGVMELRGLAEALKQLFPGHDFYSVPRVLGRPGRDAEPFDQSNTYRVSPASLEEGLKTNRTTLVQILAGSVFPPGPKAADLALVRRRHESRKAPWVLAPQPYPWCTRERHPKAYLQWLLRDPDENACTRWKEGKQGADSLKKLDWSAALSTSHHCTWLRALVDDLADGLGEPFPVPGADAPCAQLTKRKRRDANAVLRNL
ncbi:hypothetical protein [Sorangium sp. So ce1151]|uniref:hypothetical protein n=1 Tax=Sorangium sp. So ce1151 TaxID=3133332 RepID=UPI003F62880F